MKNYGCPHCGSIDVFVKEKGTQTGLYCTDCTKWIKWISKNEIPFIETFIAENKKPKEQDKDNYDYVVRKAFDTIRMHINEEYNSKTSIVISADGLIKVFEEV